jgi:hypothetical protein
MARPIPTIQPLFATPFATVPIEGAAELNPVLAPLFTGRATPEYRDPGAPPDPLCFRGREDLFNWENEAVRYLQGQMLLGICEFVMAVNRYSEGDFRALSLQARARFWIVRPDGSLPARSAPMASWYAFYCVSAPTVSSGRVDSGALRLYAVRDGTMFMDAANWRLREPYSGAHHVWRPVPGQMAVFPASMLHEVALNRTAGDLVIVTARVRFTHAAQVALPPW